MRHSYSNPISISQQLKRDLLRDLLEECTPWQQKNFKLLYRSIESIPDDKINDAVRRAKNTIRINLMKKHE